MPHRRLVLALALTVIVAVLALIAVVSPRGSTNAEVVMVPIDTTSTTEIVSTVHEDTGRAIKAAVEADAARQAYEQAARTTTTTAPAPPKTTRPAAPVADPPVASGDAEAAVRHWFGDVFDQAWGSDHNYGVTRCESGHDPGSVSSGGGNWGLFQINSSHRADYENQIGPWSTVLDADANAHYARILYDRAGGWSDWSCAWAAYR